MLTFWIIVAVMAAIIGVPAYLMADAMLRDMGYRRCRGCGSRYHHSWEEPNNEAFWGKEDMSGLCPECTGGN